jgi:hypothetical protein
MSTARIPTIIILIAGLIAGFVSVAECDMRIDPGQSSGGVETPTSVAAPALSRTQADTADACPALPAPGPAAVEDARLRAGNVAIDSALHRPDTASAHINAFRFGLVSAGAMSSLVASYIYIRNSWWSENPQKFHLDNGPDMQYALNLDKLGHVFGGAITADVFGGALRWSGVPEEDSYLYAAAFSGFVQIAIEIKDGFAPRYGFSILDVASGVTGGFLPYAQRWSPFFAALDLKFSYWRRSERYWQNTNHANWNDDYINQTYWLSFRVHDLLPQAWKSWWPRFLELSIGASIDEHVDGAGGGHVELFIAPDIDLTAFVPHDSGILYSIFHFLNYIKFPTPAVRIMPHVTWFGLYF